jgi:hypothetical protein
MGAAAAPLMPSKKVTEPVGVPIPLGGATVAVKVTVLFTLALVAGLVVTVVVTLFGTMMIAPRPEAAL